MTRLAIANQEVGMHPSESLVKIQTIDGIEELFVDSTIIENRAIPAWPVERRSTGDVLVELPRETMRGKWRVWVNNNALLEA